MRFSVVFGVTLRLLVINVSSSFPTINTAAYYQRCVITCKTVAAIHRRPCLQHLPIAALTQAVKPDNRLRIAISPYPTCIRRPVWGVSVGKLLCRLAWKTRMAWLPDDEKVLMPRLFVSTQSTNVTDTRTHTHRMTA